MLKVASANVWNVILGSPYYFHYYNTTNTISCTSGPHCTHRSLMNPLTVAGNLTEFLLLVKSHENSIHDT